MKDVFKSIVVSILTAEAAYLLKRKRPTIIAITGNVGKTSTKDAIYAAIKSSVSARKSEKSFNSEIGVPLTILGLPNGWNSPVKWLHNIIDGFFTAFFSKEYPAVLVLETGIDRPGDMARLTSWLKPDIAVLTRLPSVPVHVEYFSTPEAVVEEKMKLVSALKPQGVLIYNNDDEVIVNQLAEVRHKAIGYSRYRPSEYTAARDTVTYSDDKPTGVKFEIVHADEKATVELSGTIGTQHLYAASAAVAVAGVLGVPLTTAADGLKELKTPSGRMRLIKGIKSSVIIDDTYNASPTAVEHALEALREVKYAKRKIVVIGDMLELGRYSSDAHERIGTLIPDAATILFTVGVRARKVAESALAQGMSEKNVFQYDDAARAGRELQALLQSGDIVLIKASQGIRAERIVEEVMAEPELAGELLVRQDTVWRTIE